MFTMIITILKEVRCEREKHTLLIILHRSLYNSILFDDRKFE